MPQIAKPLKKYENVKYIDKNPRKDKRFSRLSYFLI